MGEQPTMIINRRMEINRLIQPFPAGCFWGTIATDQRPSNWNWDRHFYASKTNHHERIPLGVSTDRAGKMKATEVLEWTQ
jgi:hypothetical protein